MSHDQPPMMPQRPLIRQIDRFEERWAERQGRRREMPHHPLDQPHKKQKTQSEVPSHEEERE